MGVGLGLVMGPDQAAALSTVAARDSGVASGVLSTMRYLGGLAGVSIIAVLLDGGTPVHMLAGHRLCLWIYFGAHVAAMAIALYLPDRVQADADPAAAL